MNLSQESKGLLRGGRRDTRWFVPAGEETSFELRQGKVLYLDEVKCCELI